VPETKLPITRNNAAYSGFCCPLGMPDFYIRHLTTPISLRLFTGWRDGCTESNSMTLSFTTLGANPVRELARQSH
jgi:hypothetical protein